MTEVKQELPKWFDGQIYKESLIVENLFSKEEYELNNIELSMYDFIIGANFLAERDLADKETMNNLRKGLNWFRKNNAEAYMVLLD